MVRSIILLPGRSIDNHLENTLFRATSLVKHVIRTFVLHASITRPLSEMGKLQLTTDMTELEFALSAFMVSDDTLSSPVTPGAPGGAGAQRKQANRQSVRRPAAKLESIGSDYLALRGLRSVLDFFRQKSLIIFLTLGCHF